MTQAYQQLASNYWQGRRRRTKSINPPNYVISQYYSYILSIVDKLQSDVFNQIDLDDYGVREDASDEDVINSAAINVLSSSLISTELQDKIYQLYLSADRSNRRKMIKYFEGIPDFERKRQIAMLAMRDKFLEDNVKLIRALVSTQTELIKKTLAESADKQLRVEQVRDQIKRQLKTTKSRARLIAVDQILTLNSQMNRAQQREVGIDKYIWSTSKDELVRGRKAGDSMNHIDLDGHVFSWTDPPITNLRTGARAHPGEDIRCRCTAIPYY